LVWERLKSSVKKNLGAFWKLVVAKFSSYIQNSVKTEETLLNKLGVIFTEFWIWDENEATTSFQNAPKFF
jgi:hypothetical protein